MCITQFQVRAEPTTRYIDGIGLGPTITRPLRSTFKRMSLLSASIDGLARHPALNRAVKPKA